MKNIRITLLILVAIILLSCIASAHELPIGIQRLKEYQMQLASSITLLLAFFAGLISMLSPCGIAMLPAFFAASFKDKKKSVLMASAFSLGLLVAFTIFGIVAGLLGNFLNEYKLEFAVFAGFALIIFGVMLLLNIGFTLFSLKLDYSKNASFIANAALGFWFGVAWTPCIGPILTGILLLAASSSTFLNGTLMLVFYGLGISTPLIVLAYFSDRYDLPSKKFFHAQIFSFRLLGRQVAITSYNLLGGAMLIILGILIVLFKGTFFFQTELPKYVPWSMSFWDYLNEKAIESKILTSIAGNIIGITVGILLIFFIMRHVAKKDR